MNPDDFVSYSEIYEDKYIQTTPTSLFEAKKKGAKGVE